MDYIEELEHEVRKVDEKLLEVRSEIEKLEKDEKDLFEKKGKLRQRISVLSKYANSLNLSECNYKWFDKLKLKLNEVFKVQKFKDKQLYAMYQTLSGKDILVVMPTGAGKSLCYQLPALVQEGFTLVISPLVSLIEEQVKSLKEKNILALYMSSTDPEQTSVALNHLKDKDKSLKLLYVTPERLVHSPILMENLQISYKKGMLRSIAIDEVHCCSQWGMRFREDYRKLGLLKNNFPEVPILGLTATATSSTLNDVQEILNISGCEIIKIPFNRPNLFYQILEKPKSQNECLDILETMLRNRYNGQSGIIYAYSKKEAEDLAKGLIKRELRVAYYHAELHASEKTTVYNNWQDNYIQAIIATEAFGMGIDKRDVRFVIHHTISKSMENYQQESGRAGRDKKKSECVILYRMQDIFKVSALAYSNGNSKEPLYAMIKYCLNGRKCRRQLLAEYIGESWINEHCDKMCDVCCNDLFDKELDLTKYCRIIASIIANEQHKKLTAINIIDLFIKNILPDRVIDISRAEDIIAFLLAEEYLEEDYYRTEYNTVVYIKNGKNMHLADDPNFSLIMPIRRYFIDSFDITKKAPNDSYEPKAKKSRHIITLD